MRKCEYCGRSIVYKNAHARFCSDKCRNYARRSFMRNPIPAPMRENARWVRWRIELRNGKPTKVPLQLDGTRASSTNVETWTSWLQAKESAVGDGLGYVLGDGIACIDLDHCLIEGEPTDAARRFLDGYTNNYIEVSPSGDGLHIWGSCEEQSGRRFTTPDGLSVEFYAIGRYITITENVYQRGELYGIAVPVISAHSKCERLSSGTPTGRHP